MAEDLTPGPPQGGHHRTQCPGGGCPRPPPRRSQRVASLAAPTCSRQLRHVSWMSCSGSTSSPTLSRTLAAAFWKNWGGRHGVCGGGEHPAARPGRQHAAPRGSHLHVLVEDPPDLLVDAGLQHGPQQLHGHGRVGEAAGGGGGGQEKGGGVGGGAGPGRAAPPWPPGAGPPVPVPYLVVICERRPRRCTCRCLIMMFQGLCGTSPSAARPPAASTAAPPRPSAPRPPHRAPRLLLRLPRALLARRPRLLLRVAGGAHRAPLPARGRAAPGRPRPRLGTSSGGDGRKRRCHGNGTGTATATGPGLGPGPGPGSRWVRDCRAGRVLGGRGGGNRVSWGFREKENK